VTAAHLRQTRSLCSLRLAKERSGKRGDRGPQRGFEVSNRIAGDARQAHSEMRVATMADFPLPRDLTVEQRAVYSAAAAWYVALFAGSPACTADVDEWSTADAETGTLLVGHVGLAVDCADGRAEVRTLAVSRNPRPPDDVSRSFALVRLSRWIGDRPVDLVWADLVSGHVESETIDAPSGLEQARGLLAPRLSAIEDHVGLQRPRPGQDCARCRFVAECSAHK